MKKIVCVIAIAAVFAACGNNSSNNSNADSTKVGPDTTMHTDSSNMMMQDTTHKDTTHK